MKKLLKSRVLSSVLSIIMLLTLVNGIPARASKGEAFDTQVSLASQLMAEEADSPEIKPDSVGVEAEQAAKPEAPKPEATRVLASTGGQVSVTPANQTVKTNSYPGFTVKVQNLVPREVKADNRLYLEIVSDSTTRSSRVDVYFNRIDDLIKRAKIDGDKHQITTLYQGYVDNFTANDFTFNFVYMVRGPHGETFVPKINAWIADSTGKNVLSEVISTTATVMLEGTAKEKYSEKTRYNINYASSIDPSPYKGEGYYDATTHTFYDQKPEGNVNAKRGRFYTFTTDLEYDTYFYRPYQDLGVGALDIRKPQTWDYEYYVEEDGAVLGAEEQPVFVDERFIQETGTGFNNTDMTLGGRIKLPSTVEDKILHRAYGNNIASDIKKEMKRIEEKVESDGKKTLSHTLQHEDSQKKLTHFSATALFFVPIPDELTKARNLHFKVKNFRFNGFSSDDQNIEGISFYSYRVYEKSVAVVDFTEKPEDYTIYQGLSSRQLVSPRTDGLKEININRFRMLGPVSTQVRLALNDKGKARNKVIHVNQFLKFDLNTMAILRDSNDLIEDNVEFAEEYLASSSDDKKLLYAVVENDSDFEALKDKNTLIDIKANDSKITYYTKEELNNTANASKREKIIGVLFEYRNGKMDVSKEALKSVYNLDGKEVGEGFVALDSEIWVEANPGSYHSSTKPTNPLRSIYAVNASSTNTQHFTNFREFTYNDWKRRISQPYILPYKFVEYKWGGKKGTKLIGSGVNNSYNLRKGERYVVLENDFTYTHVKGDTYSDPNRELDFIFSLQLMKGALENQDKIQLVGNRIYYVKVEDLSNPPQVKWNADLQKLQIVGREDQEIPYSDKILPKDNTYFERYNMKLTPGYYNLYSVLKLGDEKDVRKDLGITSLRLLSYFQIDSDKLKENYSTRGINEVSIFEHERSYEYYYRDIDNVLVTRSGDASFESAEPKKNYVSPLTGPEFEFFMENPAADITDFAMLSILPYEGDGRGSENVDGHSVRNIKFDKILSKNGSELNLWYTENLPTGGTTGAPKAKDLPKNTGAKLSEGEVLGVRWTKATKTGSTYEIPSGVNPKALIFEGNFKQLTDGMFTINLKPNANKINGKFILDASVKGIGFGAEGITASPITVKVVSKSISGTIKGLNGTGFVPNASVSLVDKTGAVVQDALGQDYTVKTDSTGNYVFNNVADVVDGVYNVKVNLPSTPEYSNKYAEVEEAQVTGANLANRIFASAKETFRKILATLVQAGDNSVVLKSYEELTTGATDETQHTVKTKNFVVKEIKRTISGIVFEDKNGNGIKDGTDSFRNAGEAKVELYKGTTKIAENAYVAADGSYKFDVSSLAGEEVTADAGKEEFTVKVTFKGYKPLNQFIISKEDNGTNKVATGTGEAYEYKVKLPKVASLHAENLPGEDKKINLGLTTVTKTITGKVTKDGKVPSSAVTVTLQDASGITVATTTTDNSGAFTFENPADHASYKVSVPAPVKGEFIIHALDTTTSHQTNTTEAFAMGTYRDLLTANTLTKTQNVNFLYTTTSKTIKGQVSLPGVTNYSAYTVTLYEKKNDGSFTAITQSVADDAFMTNLKANGTYKFVNPADSETKNYKVVIGGFTKGSNQFGELTKEIADVDNYSDIFTAHYTNPSNSLKKDFTLDFAVTERSKTIKGTVKKVNGSPIANMDITLLEVTSTGEKAIETDLANATYEVAGKGKTDASGRFEFKNPKDAENGRYIVRIGSVLDANQKMEVKVDSNWSKAGEKAVSLGNYAALSSDVTETVEFRMTELSKSITGQVKFGGQGTDKFNVELYTKAGVKVAGPIQTDSNGNYTFSNITNDASDYVVKLVKKGTEPTFTYDHIKKTTVDGKDTFSNLGAAVSDKDLEIPVKSETFDQMWAGTETAKSQSAVIDFVKVTSSVSGKILDANDNGKDGVTVEIYRGRKTGDPEKIATVLTKNGGIFSFDVQDKETENGDYIIKVVGPKPVKGEYIVASYAGSEEATNELTIQADTRLEAAKAGNSSVSLAGVGFKYAKVTKVIKGSVVDEDANVSHVGKTVNLFVGTEKIATAAVQADHTYSFDLDLVAADKNAADITYKIVVDTTLAKNAFVRIAEGTGEYGDASKTLEKTVSMRSYKTLQAAKANEEKTVNFKFGKIKKSIKVLVRKDGGDENFANGVALERAHFTLSLQDSAGGGFTTASSSEVQPTVNQAGTEFEFDLPTDTNDKNYYVTLNLTDKNNEVYLFLDPREERVGEARKTIGVSLDNFENLIADANKADRTKTVQFFLKSMKKNENPSKSITVKAYVDEDKSETVTDGDKPYVGGTLSLTDGVNKAVAPEDTTKNYDNAVTSNDGTYTFLDPKDAAAYKVGFALKSGDEPYYTFVEEDTNSITLKSYYDLKYDQNGNGTENKTKMFRLKRYSKTIKGKLWDDKNKDGNVDDGENPFANVELILTDKQGNPITKDYLGNDYIFKTNEQGEYEFTNLPEKDGYIFKIKLEPNNFSHIKYQVVTGTYDEKTGEVTLPTYNEVKNGTQAELTVNVGLIKRIINPYYPFTGGDDNGGGDNNGGGNGGNNGNDNNGGNGGGGNNGGANNGGNGGNNGGGNDDNNGGGQNGGEIIGNENPPVNPPVVKDETNDYFIPPFVISNEETTNNEPEVTDIDVENVPLGDADLNLDVLDDELPQGAGNIKPNVNKGKDKNKDKNKDKGAIKDNSSKDNNKDLSGGNRDKDTEKDGGKKDKVVNKILAKTGGMQTNLLLATASLFILMMAFFVVEFARRRKTDKK